MIQEDKFGLRPMWLASLEIYDEIAKICERHHLVYYVSDGTLLGAIRHKGFIPWDDDLDMSMPRPDYEQFKKYAKEELPMHLKFLDWTNAKEFGLLFGKVHETRKEKILELEEKVGYKMSNGLFVDIFPIDGCPVGRLATHWYRIRTFVLRAMIRFRLTEYKRESKRGRLVWMSGMFFSCLFPWLRTQSQLMRLFEKPVKWYPYETSALVGRGCSDGNVLRKRPVPRSVWENRCQVEFYDRKVSVPSEYDRCLRNEYGDYMKLPSVEKQKPTHSFSYRNPWWLGPTGV